MIRNHHDACIARFLTSSLYTCIMPYQFQTIINISFIGKQEKKKKNLTAMDTYTHSEPIYKLTDKIFTNFRSLNEQLIKEIEKKHTALASLYSETAL